MSDRSRDIQARAQVKKNRGGGAATFAAFRNFTHHLSAQRRRQCAGVIVFMLVGAVAEMASIGAILPFLTLLATPDRISRFPVIGRITEHFALSGTGLMVAVTAIFVIAAALAAIIRLGLLKVSQRFIFQVGHDLTIRVYDGLLHKDYVYYMQNNSADALATLQKVNVITSYFLQPAMQALISATVGIFIISALIYADPLLALVALGSFSMLYFAIAVPSRTVLRRNSRIAARVQGERIQSVQEGMGGIRDVLLDRAQPIYLRRFAALDGEYRDAQAMTTLLGMAPRFLIEGTGMILIALIAFGFARQQGGILAVLPMLGALAIGAQRLMPLLQQIYVAWVQMTANHDTLVDVLRFLDQPMVRPPERVEPLPFRQRIDVEHLSFRYAPNAPTVLHDVTFTIPAGATVGIVGETGSGKSTLLDLLMGLLDAGQGSIRIDGQALDGVTRWSWQRNISHVPQFIYLTDGTIAENIAFGLERQDIDMARVREVARLARIADYVEGLADGYDSIVGERGQRLSGGQRQRIGIARALYARRTVLVLDEATSALDTETETAIMDAIGGLSGEHTVIIVAHRLSTLRNCSHIFRFAGGRLVAQGSFDEVISDAR